VTGDCQIQHKSTYWKQKDKTGQITGHFASREDSSRDAGHRGRNKGRPGKYETVGKQCLFTGYKYGFLLCFFSFFAICRFAVFLMVLVVLTDSNAMYVSGLTAGNNVL